MGGSTAGVGKSSQIGIGANYGRKWMISGSKLGGFRGWKVGILGEMLDPLVARQIHGTNSRKSRQIKRSQKKFGAIFVGNFLNWEEHNKNKLENKVWGSKFVINLCS